MKSLLSGKDVLVLLRNKRISHELAMALKEIDSSGLKVLSQTNGVSGTAAAARCIWDSIIVDPLSRAYSDPCRYLEQIYDLRNEFCPRAQIILLSDFRLSLKLPIDPTAWRFIRSTGDVKQDALSLCDMIHRPIPSFQESLPFAERF